MRLSLVRVCRGGGVVVEIALVVCTGGGGWVGWVVSVLFVGVVVVSTAFAGCCGEVVVVVT